MSMKTKERVLAKCGELDKSKAHLFGAVEVEPLKDGYFFQLPSRGEILFWVGQMVDDGSPRWAAAAQILGIGEGEQDRLVVNQNKPLPTEKPAFETIGSEPWFTVKMPSLTDVDAAARGAFSRADNRHAFDTGARWVLGQIKEPQRPSNDLLWEAWQSALISAGMEKELAESMYSKASFEAWRMNLPADPLQADRHHVSQEIFDGSPFVSSLLGAGYTSMFINRIKRLAGMEVGNG